jgi:hypothetical protein
MDSVSVSMCVPNQTWRASLIRANGPLVPRASRRVFVSFNAIAYENTQQSMLMLLHIPTPKITNTQGTQILLYHTNGLQKKKPPIPVVDMQRYAVHVMVILFATICSRALYG